MARATGVELVSNALVPEHQQRTLQGLEKQVAMCICHLRLLESSLRKGVLAVPLPGITAEWATTD